MANLLNIYKHHYEHCVKHNNVTWNNVTQYCVLFREALILYNKAKLRITISIHITISLYTK